VIGFLSLVALIGVGAIGLLARIGAKRACACAGSRLQRRPTAPIATANSTSRHVRAIPKRMSDAPNLYRHPRAVMPSCAPTGNSRIRQSHV